MLHTSVKDRAIPVIKPMSAPCDESDRSLGDVARWRSGSRAPDLTSPEPSYGFRAIVRAWASGAASSIGRVTLSGQLDLLPLRGTAMANHVGPSVPPYLVRRGRPLEVGQDRRPGAASARLPTDAAAPPRGRVGRGRRASGLARAGSGRAGTAPRASQSVADAAFSSSTSRPPAAAPGPPRSPKSARYRLEGTGSDHRDSRRSWIPSDPSRKPDAPDRDLGMRMRWRRQAGNRRRPRGLRRLRTRRDPTGGPQRPVRFALSHLLERRRTAGRYFTQPWLDTLTLARRLLAGSVPRHDLATLAALADTSVRPEHRALPDAEATAELLIRFFGMLAEREVDTVERVVAIGAPGGTRHSWKLALADDLPTAPGIYLMRNRRGDVLYVGKARNLRRRVRSYFGPGGAPRTPDRAGARTA